MNSAPVEHIRRYGTVIFLVLLIGLFSILRRSTFATVDNGLLILGQISVITIMALGLTICLVAGQFDLSIAGTFALAGIVVSKLLAEQNFTNTSAIAVALVIGAVVGLLNGALVGGLRVPSFIATLGTGSLVTGLMLRVSDGQSIHGLPDRFVDLGRMKFIGVPFAAQVMIVMTVATVLLLGCTPLGRKLRALGLAPAASRVAGVNVIGLVITGFVVSGVGAALAGIVATSRSAVGSPTAGPGFLLPAFAACFLGAATVRLGQFHPVGTVIGAAILGVLTNGLTMLSAPFFLTQIISGVAIIVAVSFARAGDLQLNG